MVWFIALLIVAGVLGVVDSLQTKRLLGCAVAALAAAFVARAATTL